MPQQLLKINELINYKKKQDVQQMNLKAKERKKQTNNCETN